MTGVVLFIAVLVALLAIPLTLTFQVSWQEVFRNDAELTWAFGLVRKRILPAELKNQHGAYVGDTLTSLIETCRLAGANPLDYLSALMENRSAVFADPTAWLPWNYRDHLDTAQDAFALRHPPPVLGQLDRLGVAVPK